MTTRSALRQTQPMAEMLVRAGQDYLQQFSKKGAVDALAELVWNALDAEADRVDVKFATATLGGNGNTLEHITEIAVIDNGHGISPEIAQKAFPSLGDSWKKDLNGRSLNGKRPLHGSNGRGRFYVYSLGHRARWVSVSEASSGAFQRLVVEGSQNAINKFTSADPSPTEGPAGTTLTITVEQGRALGALLRDDLPQNLAARMAPHLLGNSDIVVRVDGRTVDPAPLVEGKPTDLALDDVAQADLQGREQPILMVVDWTPEMRKAPGVLLCTKDGAALAEVENSVPSTPAKSTGYLKWSGFAATGADLLLVKMQHPAIVDAAVRRLEQHAKARTERLAATIVEQLKEEGIYPYKDEHPPDLIEVAERQIFDLVAVTARSALTGGSRQQRAMSAQLLQLALQERPESLEQILAATLRLTEDERESLADMLRYSTLGAIVGAATEVTHRIDLVSALRHHLYGADEHGSLREVDQLHPLVRDNVWLFGESWRLSRSEVTLATVLRDCVPDTVLLEEELAKTGGVLAAEHRGRVDLLLQRGALRDNATDRLVIELKRPSVKLGNAEIAQVKKYAHALATHQGAGPGKWTFWLVGAHTKPEIEGDLQQQDRQYGHISSVNTTTAQYDIWVLPWGALLDDGVRRLEFYREQLKYDVSQDEAVARVQSRHATLLPAKPPS